MIYNLQLVGRLQRKSLGEINTSVLKIAKDYLDSITKIIEDQEASQPDLDFPEGISPYEKFLQVEIKKLQDNNVIMPELIDIRPETIDLIWSDIIVFNKSDKTFESLNKLYLIIINF